jgi:hypothetical protein
MPARNAIDTIGPLIAAVTGIREELQLYLHGEQVNPEDLALADELSDAPAEPAHNWSPTRASEEGRSRHLKLGELRIRLIPLLARIEGALRELSATVPGTKGARRQLENLPLITDTQDATWPQVIPQLDVILELLRQTDAMRQAADFAPRKGRKLSTRLASEPAQLRTVERIIALASERISHKEICDRLDIERLPVPQNVKWAHLTWSAAQGDPKSRDAVRTWISKRRKFLQD